MAGATVSSRTVSPSGRRQPPVFLPNPWPGQRGSLTRRVPALEPRASLHCQPRKEPPSRSHRLSADSALADFHPRGLGSERYENCDWLRVWALYGRCKRDRRINSSPPQPPRITASESRAAVDPTGYLVKTAPPNLVPELIIDLLKVVDSSIANRSRFVKSAADAHKRAQPLLPVGLRSIGEEPAVFANAGDQVGREASSNYDAWAVPFSRRACSHADKSEAQRTASDSTTRISTPSFGRLRSRTTMPRASAGSGNRPARREAAPPVSFSVGNHRTPTGSRRCAMRAANVMPRGSCRLESYPTATKVKFRHRWILSTTYPCRVKSDYAVIRA